VIVRPSLIVVVKVWRAALAAFLVAGVDCTESSEIVRIGCL
jgi:hypothetical protein